MPLTSFASRAAVSVCIFALAVPAFGQSIGVRAGNTSVVAAPGTKLTVPLVIDLTSAGALNIASMQGDLAWSPGRLFFDSLVVAAGIPWTVSVNAANAATGSVSFSAFNTASFPATGTLANVFFTASGTIGGTRISLSAGAAGNVSGQSIVNSLRLTGNDVCVTGPVKWGDGNNDGNVNIVDAQQIARFAVGLSVADASAVARQGDVTADGSVNIVDAQQVARFSVGLNAAARVNTTTSPDFTPSTVAMSPAGTQTVPPGSSVQLAGSASSGATDVTGCTALFWQSSNPGVAQVNSSGFVTGVSVGTTTITVTSTANASATSTKTVNIVASGGPVVSAVVTLGATTLPLASMAGAPPALTHATTLASAVARDASNTIVNATPVWTSSNPRVARVANTGAVQTLGTGTTQITATFGAVSASSSLTVSAIPAAFDIAIRTMGTMDPASQTAFDNAVTRWKQIIRGDIADVTLNALDISSCFGQNDGTTVLTETIDDLVIYASVEPIDGVGGILGSAGPCFIRAATGQAYIGVMMFDSADIASMQASGILTAVILHEMGHVLGIGTTWGSLLQDPMPNALNDPIFAGTNARWAFANLGLAYGGRSVPVENCVGIPGCGGGTINSHWRDLVLQRELMTGYVTGGAGAINPLSPLTAASLIDQSYVVDVSQSDLPPWFLRATGPEELKVEIRERSMPPPTATDLNGRPARRGRG